MIQKVFSLEIVEKPNSFVSTYNFLGDKCSLFLIVKKKKAINIIFPKYYFDL